MIDASDLTTPEVRAQYVTPLIQEILEKSSLIDHAAVLGIDVIQCDVDVASTSLSGADAPVNTVSTLFQEIATEHPPDRVGRNQNDDASRKGDSNNRTAATTRCYAELLEEASALCAYMTPQEKTVVATVATALTLAFLVPQCHFQGFLHSYFTTRKDSSRTVKTAPLSLEERLVNATLPNHNNTSGGVFPYSASRMTSLVVDDDGFTSSSFHRFLVQGMRPYFSSGMAFNWPSKDSIGSNNSMDDTDHGFSYEKVLFQAGIDLIQLLAMAICPNPPATVNAVAATPISLSMEADKGAGGEPGLSDVSVLANSTLPFSFQLSYSDRLQLVRVCKELVIPESENGSFDSRYVAETNINEDSGNRGASESSAMSDTVLDQLRSSLFEFASYQAHSEKDAEVAYRALSNVAMSEGKTAPIQFEFQRLLHKVIESRSEYLATAIGDCLVTLITKYNGSRYYADGTFVRFALGLLGRYLADMIQLGIDREKSGSELANGRTYNFLVNENATKRQKTGDDHTAPTFCKPYHLITLLKVARPLFYFLLNTKEDHGQSFEKEATTETAENDAKWQLIGDVSFLLCYPSSLVVVQSAAQLLSLALSYHGRYYMSEIANVKRLFNFTRRVISENIDNTIDIAQVLKPLIFTASRQSGIFAVSLLSYSISACSKNKRMAWKIARVISSARPLPVSTRLAKLTGSAQDSSNHQDAVKEEIMARLSCTMALCTSPSSETIQHCISLTEHVTSHWTLYQLVRVAFTTGNFGFAHQVINKHQFTKQCSQQQNFLWMTCLSKMAQAEEILGIKGAVGISQSLEVFHSCHSTLLSMAAIEGNHNMIDSCLGKFGFQLEFLRALRIDFLKLSMIARSLCAEIILTGGNVSARSNLFCHNLPKGFSMLATRCLNIYRLYGMHKCQQTRSVLRTCIAMCQFLSEFVDKILLGLFIKPNKKCQGSIEQGVSECCKAKEDSQCAMGSLIARLRVGVLEKTEESDLSHAPDLLAVFDTVTRCPLPFPRGFFHVKSIPFLSCVNISADPVLLPKKQNNDHISNETNGAEVVDVTPGVSIKLILSGVVPDEFIQSATVSFSQIIAWKNIQYDGQLYEDDDAEETHSTSVGGEEMSSDLSMPNGDPYSATLQPCGQFIMPVHIEPIMREGFYRVVIKMGCRDVRCSEWSLPTIKPLEIFLRVEDYSE